MDRARSYLAAANNADYPLPWSVSQITDIGGSDRAAKIKEIEEHLGFFPDGNLIPLTLRQKYMFKDSLSKLNYKVQKARRDCREIVEVIESFQPWEHDIKNTRLIRHFILECLSPFKRKTLQLINEKQQNPRYDDPGSDVGEPRGLTCGILIVCSVC